MTQGGTDKLLSTEENCADLVEPPTEAEMDQAITGNMAHLMVVMKAAKRFKRLLKMDGFFGRESRMVAPPHAVHGASRSADVQTRRPLHEAVANQADGIDREVDADILQTNLGKSETQTPSSLDSTGRAEMNHEESEARMKQRRETEAHHPPLSSDSDDPEPDVLPVRARTFPVDEKAKGQAHDPLEDRLFLRIGPGADVAESDDPMDEPIISESPGGVDDDIYEQAYQEVSSAMLFTIPCFTHCIQEIKRILAEREGAQLVLTRRVEHIERLRRHPNVLSSSVNHAIYFAGSTARRAEARVRSGGLAALVRDARDRARATVAEAERGSPDASPGASPQDTLDGTTDPIGSRGASRSPNPEVYRLRDYARKSAGSALKGLSKRLDETAARLEARGRTASQQPYPET